MIIDLSPEEVLWLYSIERKVCCAPEEQHLRDSIVGKLYDLLMCKLSPREDTKRFKAWYKHEEKKVEALEDQLEVIKRQTIDRVIPNGIVTLDDIQDAGSPAEVREYPRRPPSMPGQGRRFKGKFKGR
jgi:hypothetical protein